MRTIFKGWVKLFRDSVTQPWYKEPAARDVYFLLLVLCDSEGIVNVRSSELLAMLGKVRRNYVFDGINILVEHRVVERISAPHNPLVLRLVGSIKNDTPGVSNTIHQSIKTDTPSKDQCIKNDTPSKRKFPPIPPLKENIYKNTPHTPHGGIVDENQRKVFDELLSEESRAIREQLCMSYGITEEVFHDLLQEIAAEWDAVEEPDRSRKHIINTIRIKARLYGNDQKHRRDTITTSRAKGFRVITDGAVEDTSR